MNNIVSSENIFAVDALRVPSKNEALRNRSLGGKGLFQNLAVATTQIEGVSELANKNKVSELLDKIIYRSESGKFRETPNIN